MAGGLVDYDLERIWKETIIMEVLSRNFLGEIVNNCHPDKPMSYARV